MFYCLLIYALNETSKVQPQNVLLPRIKKIKPCVIIQKCKAKYCTSKCKHSKSKSYRAVSKVLKSDVFSDNEEDQIHLNKDFFEAYYKSACLC